MSDDDKTNFLYLNRDNCWADFHWSGLELAADGALTLASLPLLQGDPPPGLENLPPPTGAAGIALGPDGAIFAADPAKHRLLRIDPCDGALTPVPCLAGEGREPTRFQEPRGVLYHPLRQAILVSDHGNHRIQIFAGQGFQFQNIWGREGTEAGCFNGPGSLASDADGNVYVVDEGNRRVQKFDLLGQVVPAFWETMQEKTSLSRPIDLAVGRDGELTKIFILDASLGKIFIFAADGHPLDSIRSEIFHHALGMAVAEKAMYVGDNQHRQVHKFALNGSYIGAARGYQGPVAGLGFDARGDLLVHTGSGLAPVRLAAAGAYAKQGVLWGGPFLNPSRRSEQWHWLRSQIAAGPGARFRLFVYSLAPAADTLASEPLISPPPPVVDAEPPFSTQSWQPLDFDAPQVIFPGAAGDRVWVGLQFNGEGLTSPILSQMRLEFDHETYLQFLPAIFQENQPSRAFLARFLTLFESLFGELEDQIAGLSARFDPQGVSAELLPWLAGWLAANLDENWSEEKRRRIIAGAFEMYARRGTVAGLRQTLQCLAGVDPHIEEPILQAAWWSLPPEEGALPEQVENSLLGFTTRLVAAEPQGAVLGTTAVLDQSHLISQEEFGVPLFEDLAHRFIVQVYRGQIADELKLKEVRAIIDREKPAHADYHLCIIEPTMRLGFQARVGIDTVVAGSTPPTRLGEVPWFGSQLILAGEPPSRIGESCRLGRTTRLGKAAVED